MRPFCSAGKIECNGWPAVKFRLRLLLPVLEVRMFVSRRRHARTAAPAVAPGIEFGTPGQSSKK
jgi:hypothetical protein